MWQWLQVIGAGDPTYNAWQLVSLSPWPLSVQLAALLLLLLALWMSWRALRGASLAARILLIALRALAALLLFGLLLEPGAELMQTSKHKARLAVLVDSSDSMNLKSGKTTRWQEAKKMLDEAADDLQAISEHSALNFYRFDSELEARETVQDLFKDPARGQKTDIMAALRALQAQNSKYKLGGVLMLSDGADNSGLKNKLSAAAKQQLRQLAVPVWTLPIGANEAFKDLRIAAVHADDFAFVRNPLEIEVEIYARGLSAQELPVSLRQGAKVLKVKNLKIKPGQQHYKMTFRFVPQQTGQQSFRVEAALLKGEAVAENNQLAFALKVIRDRIRVLQVVGRPSWDERFLRQLLKANPSVDLISFFILRTQSDDSGRNDELSLIPFPTEELFTKELNTFDVVIMQNFNFAPYHMARYLPNLRSFVMDQGGAFVMVGGDLSFAQAGYQNTPIADILPVVLPASGRYERQPYAPQLSPEGLRHPILDIGRGDRESMLKQLPDWEGFNAGARAMPGAQVLLQHPYQRVQGQASPLLVVREVGQGRTMALLTDDSWYWSLPDSARGGRGQAYQQLWANALRWLMRDPALARVRVELNKRVFRPGQAVPASLRALRDDYGPELGAKLSVSLRRDDQINPPILWKKQWISGAEGEVQVQVPGQSAGAYRLQVSAEAADGQHLGQDEAVFVVRARSVERSETEARPALLKALAKQSGAGVCADLSDLSDLDLSRGERTMISRAKRVPLWNSWIYIVFFVTVVGFEWWLRRRLGYS